MSVPLLLRSLAHFISSENIGGIFFISVKWLLDAFLLSMSQCFFETGYIIV